MNLSPPMPSPRFFVPNHLPPPKLVAASCPACRMTAAKKCYTARFGGREVSARGRRRGPCASYRDILVDEAPVRGTSHVRWNSFTGAVQAVQAIGRYCVAEQVRWNSFTGAVQAVQAIGRYCVAEQVGGDNEPTPEQLCILSRSVRRCRRLLTNSALDRCSRSSTTHAAGALARSLHWGTAAAVLKIGKICSRCEENHQKKLLPAVLWSLPWCGCRRQLVGPLALTASVSSHRPSSPFPADQRTSRQQ